MHIVRLAPPRRTLILCIFICILDRHVTEWPGHDPQTGRSELLLMRCAKVQLPNLSIRQLEDGRYICWTSSVYIWSRNFLKYLSWKFIFVNLFVKLLPTHLRNSFLKLTRTVDFKFLPPANEVWGKVIFLHQFVILFTGGACVVAQGGCAWLHGGVCGCSGGCAWLLQGGCAWLHGGMRGCSGGGMHGCSGGACMVAPAGGHAWLLRRACMIAPGGMCGCSGGMHGCSVGGHAWLLRGACVVAPGGMRGFFSFFGYNEIRSISGRYASYWNAFLFFQICAGQ